MIRTTRLLPLFLAFAVALGCHSPSLSAPLESNPAGLAVGSEPAPLGRTAQELRAHMKAVAARSAAIRRNTPPTETTIRRFTTDGTVREEFVKRGTEWVSRPSSLGINGTLPSLEAFRAAPIQQGNSCAEGSCAISTVTLGGMIDDPISETTDSVTMHGMFNHASQFGSAENESLNPHLLSVGMVEGGTDALSSTTAVISFVDPNTADEIIEIVFAGTDLQSVKNDYLAYAEAAPASGGAFLILPTTMNARFLPSSECGQMPRIIEIAFVVAKSCNTHLHKAGGALLVGSIAVVTGAIVPATVPAMKWIATRALSAGIFSVAAYIVCQQVSSASFVHDRDTQSAGLNSRSPGDPSSAFPSFMTYRAHRSIAHNGRYRT